MPAKKAPSRAASQKSNVARSSAKLNKGRRFDIRIIALIAVLLIAAVGYLFVRFSQASSQEIYTADKLTIQAGVLSTDSQGKKVAKSVPASQLADSYMRQELGNVEFLSVSGRSLKAEAVRVCVEGTAPAGTKRGVVYGWYIKPDDGGKGGWGPPSTDMPEGSFTICGDQTPDTAVPGGYRFFSMDLSAPAGKTVTVSRFTVTSIDVSKPKYTWTYNELSPGYNAQLDGTQLFLGAANPTHPSADFRILDFYNRGAGTYCIVSSNFTGGSNTTLTWRSVQDWDNSMTGNCVSVPARTATQMYRGYDVELRNGNMGISKVTFTPVGSATPTPSITALPTATISATSTVNPQPPSCPPGAKCDQSTPSPSTIVNPADKQTTPTPTPVANPSGKQ